MLLPAPAVATYPSAWRVVDEVLPADQFFSSDHSTDNYIHLEQYEIAPYLKGVFHNER